MATNSSARVPAGTSETTRLLRPAGLIAWFMVGLPVLLHQPLSAPNFAIWLAAWLSFGAVFRFTIARRHGDKLLLALQSASVIAMILTLCNGFEGTLMVLVALQLPSRTTRREGILWIVAQSLLLFWAVQVHWSLRPALLLAPPYFGFQLLAYLVLDLLRRETARMAESSRLAERVRISEELHDAMGHHLTALSLNLEVAAQQARGEALENVKVAQSVARLLLADVREIVGSLERVPLDLPESLRTLGAGVPSPRLHLEIPAELRVSDPERAHVLLRCAQEIVTNAARHSGAQNLWLSVAQENGSLQIRARDDGRGAERVIDGAGLSGMRRRLERIGGGVEVETAPGNGFTVRVRLPSEKAT